MRSCLHRLSIAIHNLYTVANIFESFIEMMFEIIIFLQAQTHNSIVSKGRCEFIRRELHVSLGERAVYTTWFFIGSCSNSVHPKYLLHE